MPFVSGFLRIRKRRRGDPVDPGYGIEEGVDPGYGVDVGEGPIDPDFGVGRPPHVSNRPPGSWTGRPSHPIERPPWEKPHWPPGPTDPDWGVPEEGGGEEAGQLPGEIDPEDPPPVVPKPPMELPPGSIWPPLPPDAPTGKHMWLVYISGVGHRYGVFEVPEGPPPKPDQGAPVHPDQGGPPPTASPKG
jgi:hypothetical protein